MAAALKVAPALVFAKAVKIFSTLLTLPGRTLNGSTRSRDLQILQRARTMGIMEDIPSI
jgi:hypothetical protein